jgi:hypothetical protein
MFEAQKLQPKQFELDWESMSQVEEIKRLYCGEIKAFQEGTWQYLLDHCTPTKLGYTVRFAVRNSDDFWKRVEARKTGTFSRNDDVKMRDLVDRMIFGTARQSFLDHQFFVLQKTGKWYVRLLFWLREKINEKAIQIAKSGPEWKELKEKPIYHEYTP